MHEIRSKYRELIIYGIGISRIIYLDVEMLKVQNNYDDAKTSRTTNELNLFLKKYLLLFFHKNYPNKI